MKPNPKNFCGGNFQDWLEVNLTDKCDGHCEWCIEKNGYHPKRHAHWTIITLRAIATRKTNIILLGGEPTLHRDLQKIIKALSRAKRKVWITTNGGKLSPTFIKNNLNGITGINISIHSFDLEENKNIVGVSLNGLKTSVDTLHEIGANTRFNCNCIKGYIDSERKIERYIAWAKAIGADKIRFAELKQADDSFIDLAKILNYKYGLNDNPYARGCHSDAVILGIPVNFRQMCGLQTSCREKPVYPEQYTKQVLYYDGKIYDGWQTLSMEDEMDNKKLLKILRKVEKGEITSKEAQSKIQKLKKKESDKWYGFGCRY